MITTVFEQQCMNLVDRQLARISKGHLAVLRPNETITHYGDQSEAKVLKINLYRFYARLVTAGNIGMGEAWTDADWDSDDLAGILQLFIDNMEVLKPTGLTTGLAKGFQHLLQHTLNRNILEGSQRNIHVHYNLGNDFYRLFLDHETMMYSSALFQSTDESLAQAQINKIHRLIELADIKPEHHVLEIGCGWGGFSIEAAKQTGCRVTGITRSAEQFKFATQRVAEERLEDRVKIIHCDHRKMAGSFDRIVSIEMLEAVGHAYYGPFFNTCDRLLKPGGRVMLQVIAIPDQHYKAYRRNPDWIQHIFPGVMLPSHMELTKAVKQHSSLMVDKLDNIGIHYAETLRRWRGAFESNKASLLKQGYDGTFQRKWIYYLCYCEAAFQTRFISDLHLTLVRPAEGGG